MYKNFIKRVIDLIISLIAVIFLSPLLLVISFACYLSFRGKVFFIQSRVGKNERIFNIIKFITMHPVSINENTLRDESLRMTKTGKILRKFSLDELPQFINILKGDMSLVGPRPLLVKYLPYYNANEKVRHTVLPGITGLAQIKGRNNLSWDLRFNYDIEYVKRISLLLDTKIFIISVYKFINAKDINVNPRSSIPDLDVERSKNDQQNNMKSK